MVAHRSNVLAAPPFVVRCQSYHHTLNQSTSLFGINLLPNDKSASNSRRLPRRMKVLLICCLTWLQAGSRCCNI